MGDKGSFVSGKHPALEVASSKWVWLIWAIHGTAILSKPKFIENSGKWSYLTSLLSVSGSYQSMSLPFTHWPQKHECWGYPACSLPELWAQVSSCQDFHGWGKHPFLVLTASPLLQVPKAFPAQDFSEVSDTYAIISLSIYWTPSSEQEVTLGVI